MSTSKNKPLRRKEVTTRSLALLEQFEYRIQDRANDVPFAKKVLYRHILQLENRIRKLEFQIKDG